MNALASEIRQVSKCIINPQLSEDSCKIYNLTPWDLSFLSAHYIQNGLLFAKPPTTSISTIIEHLKSSLSQTIVHFPCLTGRLVIEKADDLPSFAVHLDCSRPLGAEFIHAAANFTISDTISSNDDTPKFVDSFFGFDGAVYNHEGCSRPLLVVQVTELVDGIFVGLSLNHSVVDGTSYWHFFNTWSEIARWGNNNFQSISRPPILQRYCIDGLDSVINLHSSHHDNFTKPTLTPAICLRSRFFHFSAKSIAEIKAKANAEAKTDKISSFQALSAFIWRSMARARNLVDDEVTRCIFIINNRARLRPALSDNYFGNCIQYIGGSATAGELLRNNIGWSAWMLHEAVENHTDKKIRKSFKEWVENPVIHQHKKAVKVPIMMMQQSPRFNVYGNDFGWGKPLGVRGGEGNRFDGSVGSYPGREDKGSMDWDISLSNDSMNALLLNDEFMAVVS